MEIAEVVETSFHPVNGKHGSMLAMEAGCQPKVSLSMNFPAKPILI
jgi:hypothetical protein